MSPNPIPLHRLPPGKTARVHRVCGRPDRVHRLAEFGLRDGALVRMFRAGNPCIIHLDGHKVCFRAEECLEVLVEPSEN